MLGLGFSFFNLATILGGISGGAASLILSIFGARGLIFDAAGGTQVNGRSSSATVIDDAGEVLTLPANTIRFSNARYTDHADSQTYNTGTNTGWEAFDTEVGGITTLFPVPTILHERAGTNMIIRSEEFDDDAAWSKGNITVVVDQVTGPDGTTASDNIFETAVDAVHELTSSNNTAITATYYTWSVYAKKGVGHGWINLFMTGDRFTGGWVRVWFDLNTGTVGTTQDNYIASIEPAANGFYRCCIARPTDSAGDIEGFIQLTTDDLNTSHLGDITHYVTLWGAQLEESRYPSSYIETTSASATRAIDSISIPLSAGTNFVQEQGVTLVRFIAQYDSDTESNSIFSIFDGLGILSDSATINTLTSTDGTNTANRSVTWLKGQEILASVIFNDSESSMSINVSLDGGIVWSGWVDATYDGTFTTGTNINLFYNNTKTNNLVSAKVYQELDGGTIATAKTWVEANAGTLTIDSQYSDEFSGEFY